MKRVSSYVPIIRGIDLVTKAQQCKTKKKNEILLVNYQTFSEINPAPLTNIDIGLTTTKYKLDDSFSVYIETMMHKEFFNGAIVGISIVHSFSSHPFDFKGGILHSDVVVLFPKFGFRNFFVGNAEVFVNIEREKENLLGLIKIKDLFVHTRDYVGGIGGGKETYIVFRIEWELDGNNTVKNILGVILRTEYTSRQLLNSNKILPSMTIEMFELDEQSLKEALKGNRLYITGWGKVLMHAYLDFQPIR